MLAGEILPAGTGTLVEPTPTITSDSTSPSDTAQPHRNISVHTNNGGLVIDIGTTKQALATAPSTTSQPEVPVTSAGNATLPRASISTKGKTAEDTNTATPVTSSNTAPTNSYATMCGDGPDVGSNKGYEKQSINAGSPSVERLTTDKAVQNAKPLKVTGALQGVAPPVIDAVLTRPMPFARVDVMTADPEYSDDEIAMYPAKSSDRDSDTDSKPPANANSDTEPEGSSSNSDSDKGSAKPLKNIGPDTAMKEALATDNANKQPGDDDNMATHIPVQTLDAASVQSGMAKIGRKHIKPRKNRPIDAAKSTLPLNTYSPGPSEALSNPANPASSDFSVGSFDFGDNLERMLRLYKTLSERERSQLLEEAIATDNKQDTAPTTTPAANDSGAGSNLIAGTNQGADSLPRFGFGSSSAPTNNGNMGVDGVKRLYRNLSVEERLQFVDEASALNQEPQTVLTATPATNDTGSGNTMMGDNSDTGAVPPTSLHQSPDPPPPPNPVVAGRSQNPANNSSVVHLQTNDVGNGAVAPTNRAAEIHMLNMIGE
ncbi:hypothetical protein FBU31_001223 [Coemansia sp. 'formosensis']|nr:hypothetical protein FBU31_001223 [Coemansia sp. 'formosensis']